MTLVSSRRLTVSLTILPWSPVLTAHDLPKDFHIKNILQCHVILFFISVKAKLKAEKIVKNFVFIFLKSSTWKFEHTVDVHCLYTELKSSQFICFFLKNFRLNSLLFF